MRKYLFLCSSPRTGSHRLCDALYALGLGIPKEYFNSAYSGLLAAEWGLSIDFESTEGMTEYWRHIVRKRTRNGVVAISVFGSQLRWLQQVVTPSDRAIFIHLSRRNLAAQVASLIALYQTKMPFENNTIVPGIPDISEISERSIGIVERSIVQQNAKCRSYIAARPHVSVTTEGFLENPGETLRSILSLGEWPCDEQLLKSVVARVRQSKPYVTNAAIKSQLLYDYAPTFAAMLDSPTSAV